MGFSVPIIPEFLYNIRHREDGQTYEMYEAQWAQQQIVTTPKIITTPETLFLSDVPSNSSVLWFSVFKTMGKM